MQKIEKHNPYSRLAYLAINDQGFAFDPVSGDSFTLNDTASRIIHELAAGRNAEEAAGALADWFIVDIDEIKDDVRDFIEQLRYRGLVGGNS